MNIAQLPGSLEEAINELEGDDVLLEALGEHSARLFVEAKRAEWNEYRMQVTEWELDRYLETI